MGRLDDREIRTPAGTKRIMVLCPFIYMYLSPTLPSVNMNLEEVSSVHWIPLSLFTNENTALWKPVTFPIARHIIPFNVMNSPYKKWIEKVLEFVAGDYSYYGIVVPGAQPEDFPIWGLTLGMTSDILTIFSEIPILSTKLAIKGRPCYTVMDIDYLVTLFTLGNRSLNAFVHGGRSPLGFGVHQAVTFAVMTSVVGKVWLGYNSLLYSKRIFTWIRSML